MDTPATSNKKPASGSKPKIDPLQLLKCLSILLNADGGIRGDTEVPRVKGLMAKYSKKLVSKCIYLNILQATELTLLDAFYDEGGWELVGTWVQEAVKSSNWPLALQVLSLLETSPMTVSRLKRYGTPRLVKELSRDCVNTDVQSIAKQIVLKWMDVVRLGDGSGTAAGVGLSGSVGSNEDSPPPMVMDTKDSKSDEMDVEESCEMIEKSGSAGAPIAIDSSQEGGDGSSSMEGQDESSNASTESDNTPAPTTPIRITIRSGSQVLAKVSSQRVSQDSNDSDDNKPLSVLKKKVQKARLNTPEESEDSETAAVTNQAQEEKSDPLVSESDTKAVDADSAVMIASSATPDTNSVSTENDNDSTVDVSSKALTENVNTTTTTTTTTTAVSTVHTVVTFSGNQGTPTSPSSSEQEMRSPKETNGEVDKGGGKVLDSDSQEQMQGESGDDRDVSDNKVDETDSKKERTDSKDEKDDKNDKDKGKGKDSEKKDKKDKEREKDKKSKDDKKKERERDSGRNSKSSSSKSRESSSRSERDRSSKEEEKSKSDKRRSSKSSSKDKERDRDKSKTSRDKDRKSSSSSSSRDKSKDKEDRHDRKKDQENEDKATLEKVKPLSVDGLAKIPRKTTSSSKTTPPSFLDALGSADDGTEAKKPSVKTYKSRGFRNTGLLDEPTKPPGKKTATAVAADKKTAAVPAGQGVKRPSPLDELVASLPDKRIKSSVSSNPLLSDKPGGVKLISPKRPSLSDDGGFMAALTAPSTVSRKKVTRKRKSSETDAKDEDKKEDDKSPTSSPVKVEEKGMLSPTNVKPTFNFYQETLKDDDEEEKGEEEEEEAEDKMKESSDTKEEKEGSGSENGEVEMKEETQNDEDDNMDIEESEDQPSIQIGLGESYGGGINGGESGLRDEDIPIGPAVPAPAQEEYEKVEVTFSEPNPESVKGVLVYHRPENRKKKSVKWRTEDDLKEVFFFAMDETERVNVNTIKFNEMMVIEKQREKELMGKNLGRHGTMMGSSMIMIGNNHMMGMQPSGHHNVIEYMRWSLLPIMIPSPSSVSPGYKSQERLTQAARESSTMAAFYHPAMLPDTPREPDQEMVSRTEPKEIPLSDVTGQDIMYDHRSKLWPEPLFGEPVNYGFGGIGPPPPPAAANDAGSHWVVGGPPAGGFPGPGGPPMYGGPGGFGGPGMGGPGMGGPGMGGPPGNFGGDMGGMDAPGWGGPGPGHGPGPGPPGPGLDYPNPNMMMGGGGQGMMMGGGGGGGRPGGPRGMMPGMGMGGQNFRGRNGPGGGNWGPGPSNYGKPPVCKHFMNGHCRHGKNCRFLHNRH